MRWDLRWVAALGWGLACCFFVLWATDLEEDWWDVDKLGNAGTWVGAIGTSAGIWFGAWSLRRESLGDARSAKSEASRVRFVTGEGRSGGQCHADFGLKNGSKDPITDVLVVLRASEDVDFESEGATDARSLAIEAGAIPSGEKRDRRIEYRDANDPPARLSRSAQWTDVHGSRWERHDDDSLPTRVP